MSWRLQLALLALGEAWVVGAATAPDIPAVGLDTAGTYFLREKAYGREGWQFSAFRDAIRTLGADFLVDHYFGIQTGGSHAENRARTLGRIKSLSAYLAESGTGYIFNLETANYHERSEYIPGQNLFEAFPGTHTFLVPDEILAALAAMPGMKAVCYDELEHMQLNNCRFIKPGGLGDVPALVDTTAMRLPGASEALVARLLEMREYYGRHGIATSVEMVWPVMHHLFARAGWTISPKILKEGWTPVPIAMALGAGVQYERTGTEVWINQDLWFCGHYPGHSLDAMRSALVYAHWLGVPRFYQENLDYLNVLGGVPGSDAAESFARIRAMQGKHHPDAEGWFGSLVQFTSDRKFQLTPYGDAFRDYARDYRPANPVPYTWREARCRIAIIRFEDSCWGQKASAFRDHLLGSKTECSTPDTEAWFGIWHRLSHGVIPATGLSFHSRHVKYKLGPRFFVPAPPTLVFDHRIGDEQPDFDFRGAQMLFLTGIELTEATRRLVQIRVQAGTTAATLPHLAPASIRDEYGRRGEAEAEIADGKGRWIVGRDFLGPKLAAALQPHLGPSDELQHQFGNHSMVVRRVDDDRVEIWIDAKRRYVPAATPSHRARWQGQQLVPVD